MFSHPPTTVPMDTLEIQNLVFPDGLTALTLWQTWKPQPASLNLSLTLDPGFASAASKDALDANTVHYGNLSKRIRLTGCPKLPMAIMSIEYDVREMARREDESTRLGNWRLEVMLPKAGTVAETVVVGSFWRGEALKGRWIEWKDLNLRVLIGVNEIERTGRQPLGLELGLWCEGDGNGMLGRLMEGFGIEEKLIEIVEGTSFETLESLGEYTVEKLRPIVQQALPECTTMSLKMRKPKAIMFADAPVVSLVRTVVQEGTTVRGSTGGPELHTIKPYV